MLPTTTHDLGQDSLNVEAVGSGTRLSPLVKDLFAMRSWWRTKLILKAILKVLSLRSLDVEYALAQIVYLFANPKKLTDFSEIRQLTKGRLSRDDPSFALIIALFVMSVDLAFALAIGASATFILLSLIWSSCVLFLGGGLLMATISYLLANVSPAVRYGSGGGFSSSQLQQTVRDGVYRENFVVHAEFSYCFDIHCNATFPLLVFSGLLSYVACPLLVNSPDAIASVLVGNFLMSIGWIYYGYITAVGMSVLPFVRRPEAFLVISLVASLILVVASCVGWNAGELSIRLFTGQIIMPPGT